MLIFRGVRRRRWDRTIANWLLLNVANGLPLPTAYRLLYIHFMLFWRVSNETAIIDVYIVYAKPKMLMNDESSEIIIAIATLSYTHCAYPSAQSATRSI